MKPYVVSSYQNKTKSRYVHQLPKTKFISSYKDYLLKNNSGEVMF